MSSSPAPVEKFLSLISSNLPGLITSQPGESGNFSSNAFTVISKGI